MAEGSIVRATLWALREPRRLVAILGVCLPMVIAQGGYTNERFAVPLGIVMCLCCVRNIVCVCVSVLTRRKERTEKEALARQREAQHRESARLAQEAARPAPQARCSKCLS